MKIRFDFYTADLILATEAMKIAYSTFNGNDESLSLYYNDYNRRKWNINGEIDHKNIEPLFTFFEANDFSEQSD